MEEHVGATKAQRRRGKGRERGCPLGDRKMRAKLIKLLHFNSFIHLRHVGDFTLVVLRCDDGECLAERLVWGQAVELSPATGQWTRRCKSRLTFRDRHGTGTDFTLENQKTRNSDR